MRVIRGNPNRFIGYAESPTGFQSWNEFYIVTDDNHLLRGKNGMLIKAKNSKQAFAIIKRIKDENKANTKGTSNGLDFESNA